MDLESNRIVWVNFETSRLMKEHSFPKTLPTTMNVLSQPKKNTQILLDMYFVLSWARSNFHREKEKEFPPLPSPTNHQPSPLPLQQLRLNLILSNGQNLRSRPGRFDFSALFQPPKKLELPRSGTRRNSGKKNSEETRFSKVLRVGWVFCCCGGCRLPCLPEKRMCPVSIFTPWEDSHKTIDNF